MNIDSHKRAIRESLEGIQEALQKGLENRQRTIGFHTSAAAADILELFLHSKNVIDPGMAIKHDYFASERKAKEKLEGIEFEHKNKILELLLDIEGKRNLLCYGKQQSPGMIESAIKKFNEFRSIFDKMGVDYEQ